MCVRDCTWAFGPQQTHREVLWGRTRGCVTLVEDVVLDLDGLLHLGLGEGGGNGQHGQDTKDGVRH